MSVTLARHAGFCSGVKKTVDLAYGLLREQEEKAERSPLYMYGDLIHNRLVIDDLMARGMQKLSDIEAVEAGATVIIRAHGITPLEYRALLEKNVRVVDGTCPYVGHIHDLVKTAWKTGRKILLIGDPDHPEVRGINGECQGEALIIRTVEEAEALETGGFGAECWTSVVQTTFSIDKFNKILSILQKKIANLQAFDTMCSATDSRQKEAGVLASQSDVMLVIGSKNSSNTMKLLDICRSKCDESYLIETIADLDHLLEVNDWSRKAVGITAGASSPNSIIMEVLHRMNENETMNEQDVTTDVETAEVKGDESFAAAMGADDGDVSFEDFIDNIPQLHRGATVKGVIVRYDDDTVYVDVKDKTEGRIPRREFDMDEEFDLDAAIDNQQEIDVYVRNIRSTDHGKEIILSKAKVDFVKYRNLVEEAYKNKTPIVVKVVNVVKDGVIASYGGVDIYIHRTQLEMGTVDDLEPYRGQTMEILVTQFDPDRRRLRVSGSRRSLLNAERKDKAEQVWENIQVGDIYDGIVRNLTDFGAFVDIGGVDGLVHISELSWARIKHPSEVVKVGDTIQVYVKDFDADKKRISLGYKRIEDDPYNNIEDRFPVGSVVKGKVVRMFNFGAFVEIADGVDALCHISQISNRRLAKPDEVLEEGMEVEARVLEVSNERRRISISIKDVSPIDTLLDPDQAAAEEAAKAEAAANELPTSYVDEQASAAPSADVKVIVETEAGEEALAQVSETKAEAEAKESEEA